MSLFSPYSETEPNTGYYSWNFFFFFPHFYIFCLEITDYRFILYSIHTGVKFNIREIIRIRDDQYAVC